MQATAQPSAGEWQWHPNGERDNVCQTQLLLALALAAAGGWVTAGYWRFGYANSEAFRRGLESGSEHNRKHDWWFNYDAGTWVWGSFEATSTYSSLNP
jgi:hypothetical protein